MIGKLKALLTSRELFFQIILHLIVFVFYSVDRVQPQIEQQEGLYFLSYAMANFFISYYLLPQYYYRKKHLHFFIYISLTIIGVILIEELVLEQIYYPDTRAKSFPGVFYTLMDVLPVIVILSGFKFAWDAFKKQKEVDDLKTAVRESELQFLKSQINPHFLFNNLNNLYAYAIENSPKTPSIILELSGVLRYMLYECREQYVPLSKEIAQLENFINLSEMQIEERGEVSFVAHDIQEGYRIAPLILIVFIENAFKHSTASQSENIVIESEVHLDQGGILRFSCKNSHQAQSNTDNLSRGIGLENVKKRLELLYPETHQLTIKEEAEMYEVHLSMNLNEQIVS
jgi:two-component system LytT family sensor kinase